MIRIMIVDDTEIFRDFLRYFIDWNSYGFEICCEAKDGLEALSFYDKYQPDIVLTDIVMPNMDGLELAERLLAENPDVAIVLISASSEFAYAQKAVKLGICDYIVKPFERDELIFTLLKLQDTINRVLETKNEKYECIDQRREQKLLEYIYSHNITELSTPDSLVFQYNYFLFATMRIDLYENQINSEAIINWKQVLFSTLGEKLRINGKRDILHDLYGNIIVILNFKDEQSMFDYTGNEFEEIAVLAKEHLGFNVFTGISNYCYNAASLCTAYHQTLQILSSSYTNTSVSVFDCRKVKNDSKSEFYSWTLIEEINNSLFALDYSRLENLIIDELDRINEYDNVEFAMMIYMSLLSLLFSFLVKLGRNIDDIFGRDFHPYSKLSSQISFEERKQFICHCYQLAINYQLEHQDSRSRKVAEQAQSYIDENYSDARLSITGLSAQLLVNQTYLRKMFKEEFSMTLSDYITKVRMDKALEIIKSEKCKLSYVASKVGYNDTSYFSKCFKKYYGYLPSDIINR